jgi:hypothetical protein
VYGKVSDTGPSKNQSAGDNSPPLDIGRERERKIIIWKYALYSEVLNSSFVKTDLWCLTPEVPFVSPSIREKGEATSNTGWGMIEK